MKTDREIVLEKEVAELFRKLAEQQAAARAYQFAGVALLERMSAPAFGIVRPIAHSERDMVAHIRLLQTVVGGEELNTLLAQAKEEGRKEAVPDGWQVVPKAPTVAMLQEGCAQYYHTPDSHWKAMLASAPTPKDKP